MEIRRATILGFTLFMAGLALCGVGLWLLLSPAQYRATAKIKLVEAPLPPMSSVGPPVIQTTFEIKIIKSPFVLSNVVSALNLNVEWGGKYAGGRALTTNAAIAILKKHLNLAIERNTKLIEISFTSDDPNEAAGIANAIAGAYQDYRLERRNQMTLKGIEVLQQEYQEEEKKIQIQQTNVDLLREKLKIQDDVPLMSPCPSPTTSFPISISDSGRGTNEEAQQPYWMAKRNLENLLAFHKLLQAKIAALKIDLYSPSTAMVQIMDAAQPPELPTSPNRFLGAVLLAIGLFSTIGGFLMLKSSRHRLHPVS